MKRIVFFLLAFAAFFLLAIWLFSYSNNVEKIDLQIKRFEQAMFSIDSVNVSTTSMQWDKDFGSFNDFFASQIIQTNRLDTQNYYNRLLDFTQDKDIREANDSIALLFSDFSDIQHDLELAFSNFKASFPSYHIPEITTFFGGFKYGVITYDNNIGIGLDFFLGQNSKYYQYLRDPKYLRFQKQRRFLVSNVMEVWFNENFHKSLVGHDLLSHLIYKGKMMFFLDMMLPDMPLQDKFRFTREQMAWVQDNESSIWEYFIYENLLFSKKEREFRSFVNFAPFAKGMPKEAPARVGYFIGYKIVRDYMKNNDVDIEEMIYLTDSKYFLSESKYKPNK